MKSSNPIKPNLTRDINLKINLRGIYGNCILSCVKLITYNFSYSQAVRSDLMCSALGAVNHIFRYLKIPNISIKQREFFDKNIDNRNS